jgi:NifB/MoaA-like Fe-S oxidoreductase
MVRSFANDFESLMKGLRARFTSAANGASAAAARPSGTAHKQLHGTILTGALFAPVLEELVGRINEVFGSRLRVVPAANDYFGGDVSVAGLLTGGDFLAAREQVQGDFAIIPNVALKSDEPIFLDGMRFEELGQHFKMPVHAFDFEQFASFLRTNLLHGGNSLN